MVYVYSSKHLIIVYFVCIYLPRYYLYAVIVSILVVWRNLYTTMVLIPRENRDMSITQSFHIPLIINCDSCQYYEVFILRKHIKSMLRNWNWSNIQYSQSRTFEMFTMNTIILFSTSLFNCINTIILLFLTSHFNCMNTIILLFLTSHFNCMNTIIMVFPTSLFNCMNTTILLHSTSPFKCFNLNMTYILNVQVVFIFILYSMLECVHIREQISRSIWYYFYIDIHFIDNSTIYNIIYALSPYYHLVNHIYNYWYVCLMYYVILITTSFMRNEVRYIVQMIFLKKHENLNLFIYDHDVHLIIDFIYSVFSHYLDNSDLDDDNTNTYIINYNYQIGILLMYEKLHSYMQIYTIVFFIVYMYLHTEQYNQRKYPTQENKDKYKKFRNQNLSNQRKAERA